MQIYVRNRVSQIVEETKDYTWKYICSKPNLADVVSRGQLPEILRSNELWWKGTDFLHTAKYQVNPPGDIPDADLPELKHTPIVVVTTIVYNEDELPVFSKFSSFRKLQRVLAYVLRFISNCKQKQADLRTLRRNLTINELRNSLELIIKVIQHEALGDEIR